MLVTLIEKLSNCQNNHDSNIGFSILVMFRQQVLTVFTIKDAERKSWTSEPKKSSIFFKVLRTIPVTHICFRNLAKYLCHHSMQENQ
jgi:hypothetical protein